MKALMENRERGSLLFPFQHYNTSNKDGNLFIPYHWHEEIEIIYCMAGQVQLFLNGSTFELGKDDIFFINKEEFHQFCSTDPDMSYCAYVFPLENLQFLPSDYCQNRYLRPLLEKSLLFPTKLETDAPCYNAIRQEIQTIIQVNDEKSCAYQLVTKASLLKIIACLAQHKLLYATTSVTTDIPGTERQTIRRIINWLEQHTTEKVTLEEIAADFHMSPKYFSRYFKKHFQRNFSDYLLHLRIDQACMMLISTDKAVADIAFLCGFSNTSYFIKKFRQVTGHTPLVYRNR